MPGKHFYNANLINRIIAVTRLLSKMADHKRLKSSKNLRQKSEPISYL